MVPAKQVLSVLAVSALLAGCGGSDDDEPTTAASTASSASTAPDGPTTATGPTTTAATATTEPGPTTTAAPATGDAGAYASTYERECAKLVTTLSEYQQRFSGDRPPAKTKRAIVKLYKAETGELLVALRSMFRNLAQAEPPAEYAEFQRSIVAVLPQVELKVERAERVVRAIRSAEQAPNAGTDVKRALSSVSTDAFPKSLQGQAPSCQRFG